MANCFANMLNLVFQQDNSIGEKKKSLEKMVLCQFSIHKQKNESGTYSQIIHNSKWINNLNVKAKTIKLSTEEMMFLNCGVGEDSWESLGLQGDPTSPF